MSCWQCQAEIQLGSAQCDACGALQPPNPHEDYFTRLGVERSFAIDLDELAKTHRRLQRRFHPDRFVSHGDRQRRFSLEHATALNDAFRTLRDPIRRAHYLLKLRGLDLQSEEHTVKLSPVFLMDIMELREALDELEGSDTHVERGRIEREVAHRYESTLSDLGRGLDDESASLADLAQWAMQLKYFKRVLEELHALGS